MLLVTHHYYSTCSNALQWLYLQIIRNWNVKFCILYNYYVKSLKGKTFCSFYFLRNCESFNINFSYRTQLVWHMALQIWMFPHIKLPEYVTVKHFSLETFHTYSMNIVNYCMVGYQQWPIGLIVRRITH